MLDALFGKMGEFAPRCTDGSSGEKGGVGLDWFSVGGRSGDEIKNGVCQRLELRNQVLEILDYLLPCDCRETTKSVRAMRNSIGRNECEGEKNKNGIEKKKKWKKRQKKEEEKERN